MGQDHPVSWCKLYNGKAVNDGTGTAKAYDDGRTWNTGMGHFGVRYTEANSNLVKHVVGGIRWVAGEGKQTDCSGTVWSNFRRTILVSDVNGPMAARRRRRTARSTGPRSVPARGTSRRAS